MTLHIEGGFCSFIDLSKREMRRRTKIAQDGFFVVRYVLVPETISISEENIQLRCISALTVATLASLLLKLKKNGLPQPRKT